MENSLFWFVRVHSRVNLKKSIFFMSRYYSHNHNKPRDASSSGSRALSIGPRQLLARDFLKMGGGRNFERPNVERPILRNLKISNVKSYERSSYRHFNLRNYFLIIEHSNLGFFFNFSATIFYNFKNLIFFEFSKFFLINKFCKFVN